LTEKITKAKINHEEANMPKAKKECPKRQKPPVDGSVDPKDIDKALDEVEKRPKKKPAKKRLLCIQKGRKKRAKKIAKRKHSCRHIWKIVEIRTKSKKLIIKLQCERKGCKMIVDCREFNRFMPMINEGVSFFTF